MPEPKDDPIAPLPRATLELYRDALREVRFPDLDYDSLCSAAAELCAAQLEVECIEAALLTARDAVRDHAEKLHGQAGRALSYARIYAAGNAVLSQRVAQVEQLGTSAPEAPRAQAKKRGRPRKPESAAELFDEPETADSEADEAAA